MLSSTDPAITPSARHRPAGNAATSTATAASLAICHLRNRQTGENRKDAKVAKGEREMEGTQKTPPLVSFFAISASFASLRFNRFLPPALASGRTRRGRGGGYRAGGC